MATKFNLGEGLTSFFRREQRPTVQIINPHRLPTGEFEFEAAITGFPQAEAVIEYSTDLRNWAQIENASQTPGLFQHAEARELKTAWYRIRGRQLTSNCAGFIQYDLHPRDNLIGFPFHRASMEVQSLFPSMPTGTKLTRFIAQDQRLDENAFQSSRWQKPEAVIMPGEGVILHNPTDGIISRTVVGELPAAAQRALQKAHYLLASLDPRRGDLVESHQFPIADGDQISLFDRGQNTLVAHAFRGGQWSPTPPSLNPGEAFWVAKNAPGIWGQDPSALGR